MHADPENPISSQPRTEDEERDRAAADTDGQSDTSLMDRVRGRQQQAMTELFDRYASRVYSVALRVLHDGGQAEDVTQEIFFQLWRNPESFSSSRGSLGAWLLVVARNRAIDHLRQRRTTEPVEDVAAAGDGVETQVERSTIMHRVRGILSQLPHEQQQSLEMAFFEGLTHSEIAQKTGQPLGTVKTRIRSALTSLRKRLEP